MRFPHSLFRTAFVPVLFAALVLVAVGPAPAQTAAGDAPGAADERTRLGTWISELREEALERNVSPATLDAALADFSPIERVVELDRNQPEFTMTFDDYVDRIVSDTRVADGRRYLERNRALLEQIRDEYGVQPRFLVALWGLESNFGKRMGSFPVVHALATLAWDGRRSEFFRGELLDALAILEAGHVAPENMVGSWAGAMGQPQFMPSSFKNFAVDHDGDGRADIWTSTADVLASAANYLSQSGWRGDMIWGREVRLPDGFDLDSAGRDRKKPLAEWQRLGVRRADGSDLPTADVEAAVVAPGGAGGPAYVVYDNYQAILRWNRSDYFAISVGLLADRIARR